MARFLPAVLIGLLISLALFWLMQATVMHNQGDLKVTNNLQMVEFVRLKRESKSQRSEHRKPQPPPKKHPPPPKIVAQNTAIQNPISNIEIPNIDIPLSNASFKGLVMQGIRLGPGEAIAMSANVIPLVKIPPHYPMRALSRRIEGWVKIEFTITETGTVINAVAVDAQPDKIFDRAALQAIAKWKFKPKIIDGEAFKQRAIQVMQFSLSR